MRSFSRGNLRAAWKIMRRNRGRSFLTMLGVIIGVASVISVVSIGQGVKQQVTQQINHVGTDLLTVRAGQVATQQGSLSLLSGLRVSGTLSNKDTATVRQAASHAVVVPLSLIDGTAGYDEHGQYTQGQVVATTQDLPSILNQGIAYGTFFTSDDNTSNVAVLGQTAALKMFGTVVPLGQTFTIRGQPFTVSGIFNTFGSVPLANDIDFNKAIFIPAGAGHQLKETAAPYEILVKPDRAANLDTTVSRVTSSLAHSHGDTQDFSVLRASDQLATTDRTLSLLTQLIGGVAAISLLVGGIGIMNITLVSVTERMHEIGIRKAVGATNRQILNEFMSEAIVLSVTGGILGIIAAGIVDLVLRILTSLQPVIQWQIVLIAAGVSIVVGIIFGTAPALKAARKDPISALRNE